MNKRNIPPDMKSCAYCYWFRPYNWHVGDAPSTKVSSKYMNRGCTYGWEKRENLGLPKLSHVTENVVLDGGMIGKRVCSGWRDCGAYDAGVKKGSVVIIDGDKERYKAWLIEQGILHEE